MSKLIDVALIGHGFLGKFHAQKVAQTGVAKLAYIVESNPGIASEVRKLYPQAKVVGQLNDLGDDFQAAIISTPTASHYAICEDLLKRKKHIFCEKPVTIHSAEAKALLSLANEAKVVVQVGHSERHHPLIEKIQERPYLLGHAVLTIERVASFKGRATDTDVVRDVMVHDIDLLLKLTASTPTIRMAKGFKTISTQVDTMTTWWDFPHGLSVLMTASRHHIEEKRLWTFSSQQGITELDFFRATLKEVLGGEVKTETLSKRDHLLEEQKNFFAAINMKPHQACSLDDGVSAVEWCERILKF